MSVLNSFKDVVEESSELELEEVDVEDEVKVMKGNNIFRCVADEESGVLSAYEISSFPEVDSLGLDLGVEELVRKIEDY